MAAPQEPPPERLFSLGDPLPPGPQTFTEPCGGQGLGAPLAQTR